MLGYALKSVVVEGQTIPGILLRVENQKEVGNAAYDLGALQLTNFFHQQLEQFLSDDLKPLGRQIIECCLSGGTVEDYARLLPHALLDEEV